jgi:hypothetical protein
MEQARNVLKNTAQHVDITIARSPTPPPAAPSAGSGEAGNYDQLLSGGRIKSAGPKPLARRKRRLPVIERPKSAPLAGEGLAALCHGGVGGGLLREQQPSAEQLYDAEAAAAAEDSNYVLDVCDFSQAMCHFLQTKKLPVVTGIISV